MMLLLDSSAIAIMLKRRRDKAVEIVRSKTTLNLAYYELGNIIWRECVLRGQTTPEEAASRAEEVAKIMELMKIETVESSKDLREVMELSTKLRITFYDGSYLYIARKKGLTLITEDAELKEKAEKIKVKTTSVNQL